MNANTRLRLWKEARALLPMWGASAALMVVTLAIGALYKHEGALLCCFAVATCGCVVLGVVSVGHEFEHRTLGLLLAQPISRQRLWMEKILVVSVAVSTLWFLPRLPGAFTDGMHTVPLEQTAGELWGLALVVCTAPALTLVTRSTVGGVALTIVGPLLMLMLTAAALLCFAAIRWATDWASMPEPMVNIDTLTIQMALTIYGGALAVYGWRRFSRWEENQACRVEIALPPVLAKSFDGFRGFFSLGYQSAWGSLFRKELGVQQPTFIVAAGLLILWLVLVGTAMTRVLVLRDFLLLPTVLLGLGIPVIAGIVSTAEERSLGLLDWHLTLPVSARRQWFVKVLVALGVNVVLGILLPGVLAQAAAGLLEGKRLELGFNNGEQHFLIANTVIFCAALYASTASANSMRALVGTIILFLAGAMVLNFADYIVVSFRGISLSDYMARKVVYSGTDNIATWVHRHRWPLGWTGLAVWLYFLGLANFRHALESVWQSVRRIVVFIGYVLAFVFVALVW